MKPELADIATVITIVSGGATITHYTIKAAKWAIGAYRTRIRQPIYISGVSGGSSNASATLTVGSERQILYNVEAPTPSLARRLEELASWYLHVS